MRKFKHMDLDSMGRLLLLLGAGIAVFGGLLMIGSRIPVVNQLFNLPGDIRIETGSVSCFFPIVTMIVLSVLFTIIANVVIRFLNR
jgi:hypothetical protein